MRWQHGTKQEIHAEDARIANRRGVVVVFRLCDASQKTEKSFFLVGSETEEMGASHSKIATCVNYQTADDFLQKNIRTQILCRISYIRQQTSNGSGFLLKAEDVQQPISVWYLKEKWVVIQSPNSVGHLSLLKELISESVCRPHTTTFCRRPEFSSPDEFQYDIFVFYT